jgi:hypothetical protein
VFQVQGRWKGYRVQAHAAPCSKLAELRQTHETQDCHAGQARPHSL